MAPLHRRAACLAVAVLIAGTLASCSQTVKGTASRGDAGPTTIAGLAALMHSGAQSVTSAHLALTETVGGSGAPVVIQAMGEETLGSGKTTGVDLREDIPGFGELHVIIVHSKIYAQLPESQRTSAKPWTLLTASTTNPQLKSLYTSLQASLQAGSLSSISTFVTAAGHLVLRGTEALNGEQAAHYALAVDITKLPASYPNKNLLIQAGLTSIPLELWIDGHGRTVKLTENVSLRGENAKTDVELTKYNADVQIAPPPSDQVGTD